jgi:hypothetical protein
MKTDKIAVSHGFFNDRHSDCGKYAAKNDAKMPQKAGVRGQEAGVGKRRKRPGVGSRQLIVDSENQKF